MKKKELKKRIAKYINKTVSYGYGDGFVQIDYTSPDGVEHIYIEEDIDDFTFIDFLEDYTLDILQQEIDRAREETLNDFWTYFDEGKSELLELEDKGSMSLEEIEWDFGEERFKEYINKLTI